MNERMRKVYDAIGHLGREASDRELAAETRLSVRSVERALSELVEARAVMRAYDANRRRTLTRFVV